jgi:beta-phosphoglucomutase-like phosphatase (HAD superfamily)
MASAQSCGVSAVLFDIDGTLCDSTAMVIDATNSVLNAAGYASITLEAYHLSTRYPTPDRMARHCGLLPEDPDGGVAHRRVGLELGAKFDALYISLVTPATAPTYKGIPALLCELSQHIPLAALTNACTAYAERIMAAHSMRAVFTSVHGADTVPRAKPHPDGLWQCVAELGLQRVDCGRCVYIGDSPSDGQAARAGGLRSIGVSWGSHPRSRLEPDFDTVVDTLGELRMALIEMGVPLQGTIA